MPDKRKLSLEEALQSAVILFDLNTKGSALRELLQVCKLPCKTEQEYQKALYEWRAFTHAAVLYGLMVCAPGIVVVEYLRLTQPLLTRLGYSQEQRLNFVDDALKAYSEPLVRTQTKECPAIFFRRLLNKELNEVSADTVARISGTMAMILSALLDKLEQYDYALE